MITLHGASPARGLIAWQIKHGQVSSADSVEVFYSEPPGLRRKRFVRRQPLREARPLGKQKIKALNEIGPIKVVRLFFSSSDNFPVPALLDPCLLILVKGIALQGLQVAGQALFCLLEARRIFVRKLLYLRLELLPLAVLATHREAGQVEEGWSIRRACPMAGRLEDSNVRCGKGSPEGEARGRAPYIEPLWPWV